MAGPSLLLFAPLLASVGYDAGFAYGAPAALEWRAQCASPIARISLPRVSHPGGFVAFHMIVAKQRFGTTQMHQLWAHIRAECGSATQELVDERDQCGFGIGSMSVDA